MQKECDEIGIRAWFLMCDFCVDDVVGFFAFFERTACCLVFLISLRWISSSVAFACGKKNESV